MNFFKRFKKFLDIPSIAVWENEGGALGRSSHAELYGRRIEADRSWTIYHVFSGIPAIADGQIMTGLNRSTATSGMIALNLGRTAVQGKRRGHAVQFGTASAPRKG
ncbi:hypothetical protein [Zhengella mangrovi]|uniref:hypothetical protein n=1 Tax=Zhengella mangrovi TaxID=1982044 RepID=UPI00197C2A85|nr:hypothetical protein [Zhengella mangrovi]